MGLKFKKYVPLLFVTLFTFSRLYNLQKVPPWEDNYSWLYRINYYPWILESNIKNINEEDKDIAYSGKLSYHPGVTIMTFSGVTTRIGKKIISEVDPNYIPCEYKAENCKYMEYELFVAKLPLILLSSLALYFCIDVVTRKIGVFSGLLFGIIALLEPILYSTSRDLHLDFLQASLILASLIAFLYGKYRNNNLTAGIFFGLAILTRFASLLFTPGFLIVMFINKLGFKNVAKFFITAGLTFYLLFPAMWVSPVGTIKYIISGSIDSTTSHTNVNKLTYIEGIKSYAAQYPEYVSLVWSLLLLVSLVYYLISLKNGLTKFETSLIIFYLLYFLLLNFSDKRFFRYLTPAVLGYSVLISISIYKLSNALFRIGSEQK